MSGLQRSQSFNGEFAFMDEDELLRDDIEFQVPRPISFKKEPSVTNWENGNFKVNDLQGQSTASTSSPSAAAKPQHAINGVNKRLHPSPEGQDSANKKSRAHDPTYSDALSGIPVAIVPKDYPTIVVTRDKARHVEKLISRAIRAVRVEDVNVSPVFRGFRVVSGLIQVFVDDSGTIEWLKEVVSKSLPSYSAMEWSAAPKPVKVAVWVKGEHLSSDHVKHLLIVQNRSMDIDTWQVLRNKQLNGGRQVTFSIMPACLEKLQAQNLRLNYGLSQVTFRLLKDYTVGTANTGAHPVRGQ